MKELLYQFEDLLRIEDRSIQKLLTEIDSKNLGIALVDLTGPREEAGRAGSPAKAHS